MDGVSFRYKGRKKYALKDINLEIKQGEFVAIMGSTGAGKSTLLLTMNGSIPHLIFGRFSGDVVVNKVNTKENMVYELSRHVGLVFEDPDTQIVSFTVLEDIAFGPGNLNIPREELEKQVKNALKFSRLEGYENRNPRTLSGGEKQSLAIAGILAMNPSIIAMDEPTSMLDPIGKTRVYSIIKDLNKKFNKTIILSGQEAEEIGQFADHVIVMSKGQIVAEGSPQEIFEDNILCENEGIRRPQVTEFSSLLKEKGLWKEKLPISIQETIDYMKNNFSIRENISRSVISKIEPKKIHVTIKNLTHKYQSSQQEAIKDISLDIFKGEIVALIGQNGSGKTTLAKHLVGLLRPTNKNAEIFISGITLRKRPVKEIARIANYVFQNPDHQLFSNSVIEELEYGLKKYKIEEEKRKNTLDYYIDLFRLKRYRKRRPKSLSRGLRSLTAIASVLVLQPDLIIIDEPTTGLDKRESIKIMEILTNHVKQHQQTMIYISHEMDLVARYAQRVIVLHKGEVLMDGTVREVFSQPQILEKTWLNPPQITQLSQKLEGSPDVLSIEELIDDIVWTG